MLALTVFIGNAAAEEINSTTAPEGFIPEEVVTPEIVAGAEVLLIKDVTPWDVKGNELALQELGKTYSVIPSANLATTDLSEYKIVMVASDQYTSTYTNLVSNKDKLANYVQNGGVLVAHACDHGWHSYPGWTSSWLPLGVTKVNTYQQYLSIIDSTSPIVAGTPNGGPVSDADLDGWYYSTHGYFTTLPADVHKIIGITGAPGDKPTYIEYSHGSGTVLATMQTMEWPWKHYTTEAKKNLLRNEIEYAQELAEEEFPCCEEIIARLDDETRFTDDSELEAAKTTIYLYIDTIVAKINAILTEVKNETIAIEGKLDNEANFTDDSELAAHEANVTAEIDANEAKIDDIEIKIDEKVIPKIDQNERIKIEWALLEKKDIVLIWLNKSDKVKSIVWDTINNLDAAGYDTREAAEFATKGDTFLAKGEYKRAWEEYCKAYKHAATVPPKHGPGH